MIRIRDIKIVAGRHVNLTREIENRLMIAPGGITDVKIVKESIDARHKPDVFIVLSVDIESIYPDQKMLKLARQVGFKTEVPVEERYIPLPCTKEFTKRPVICGFGPFGIFAALILAEAGLKPIVLERGSSMDERVTDVENYWKGGPLKPNSNVQFGEGGAGTFSDGKLTTGTRNPAQRYVLESFVRAGANPAILYKQKPHVGTDVIRDAVVKLRKEIEAAGGEVRFNSSLTDIEIEGGKIVFLTVNGKERIETDCLIMGLGHSARDTFKMLLDRGIAMEQKPFSIGVRVEHSQKDIDLAQYGRTHEELGIGPAEYKLSCRTHTGRGVYSFCMCPGGEVVDSSSMPGFMVCNGMSYSGRDGEKANSAILCDVMPSDFETDSPLSGFDFQAKYEHLAFEAGLGKMPKCTWGEFKGEYLPDFATESLKEAMPFFGSKIKGFDDPSVMVYGVESRSSSPVRIKRDAKGRALASDGSVIEGLYPGGEGAGYAGGIMSAACDGIRLAEFAMQRD